MSTTQPVVAQCGGCHAKIASDAMAARYPHTPVLNDRACVGCHTPHGSSLAKLVIDTPEQLCMNCHAKDITLPTGRMVQAVAELNNPHSVKHGGIKDGSCAGCHASHGGNRQLFLSKNYSTRFYQQFAPAQYELCLSCHDAKLVTDTETKTLTAFRNGVQNLHALHVRDTRERGENCRNCHNTHAGGAAMVRETIKFGAWKMPMRFSKTPTGGSCYPGCHPRYEYDRDHPAKNTVGKATPPTTMPIRAERPALIVLETTDVNGAAVKIPQGAQAAIVAVVNADASAARQTLEPLTTALKNRSDARVIIILTGDAAAARAKALAVSQKGWSILADTDGSMSAALDVVGVPTTLVLKADGSEIARICGVAESLPLKLPAYLDLAAGKIDAAAVEKKMVARDLVGDGPDKQSARDVRMIELLLDTGKPGEALKLLMKLPGNALPNWRHNLLGARALMALNRWAEAKNAAQAAVSQNPASAEARFALGQIFEQEKDWPRAAAEYRAATARQ
jgi:predicted CXXCH cytochrome family protein